MTFFNKEENMTIITGTRLQQVKAYLINFIDRNGLTRNDRLPSEESIAKSLGVSRNTIREAYISLENEGIIVRRHGVGTFIANTPYIRDSLNDFLPFSQIIKNVGYVPHFQTLEIKMGLAPSDVYDALLTQSTNKIFNVRRIVLADTKPVIFVDDYLSPMVDCESLNWDEFDGNMVDFLSNSIETPLHQIQSTIRAAIIEPEISRYLDLPVGTPILSINSTILNIENLPINYSKICFNSTLMELNIVRTIRKK